MASNREIRVPVVIDRGSDGFYTVECPLFQGCYTQGKTLKEALKNLEEVIEMVIEEPVNRSLLAHYEEPEEVWVRLIRIPSSSL